jgi:hypothetical protein
MRWLLAVATWLVAMVVLAPVLFLVTMILAGPHSSMLPPWMQPAVLVLGWVALLVGPVFAARVVWNWRAPVGKRAARQDG